jgi:hypothetical protein
MPLSLQFVANPLSESASLSHVLQPLERGLLQTFPKTQAAERNARLGLRKGPWPIPI